MDKNIFDQAWLLYQMTKIKIDEVRKAKCFRQPVPVAGHEETISFLQEVADVLFFILTKEDKEGRFF